MHLPTIHMISLGIKRALEYADRTFTYPNAALSHKIISSDNFTMYYKHTNKYIVK